MSTCNEVQDELDELVAGDRGAIARHSEHIAGCDACRDMRHETTELAAKLATTGHDHVPMSDLAARVLAKVGDDAVKPALASGSTTISGAETKTGMAVAKDDKPTSDDVAAKITAKAEESAAKITAISEGKKIASPGSAGARSDADASRRSIEKKRASSEQPVRKSRAWLAIGAAAAIAGGIGIYKMKGSSDDAPTKTNGSPIAKTNANGNSIGTVSEVARAATDKANGVSVKGTGDWRPLAKGEVIPPGATVKTDERTRVSFDLADGTRLILDHDTELAFDGREPRKMAMAKGRLVADVAHIEKRPAAITTPAGTVDVIGTKFVLTAADRLTAVQVVRGAVAVTTSSGQRDEVHAGEEGVIENGKLGVASAPSLANELGWSELAAAPVQPGDQTTAGLGALRAYKPGEKRDRDWNLALAKHDVKVRISGPIARTEITETFRNDSDATLEGVYQFPLPADAQIDGLALDIKDAPNGFLEGAFLDKNRAQKIWQGVIDKATPKIVERPAQEIIWVPGQWRDPALLDWKRGGRFELKIYPIPAKGQRTIKIAYTQVVNAKGPFRQYVYPLAHSTDGSTVADNFTVDVEVRGAMPGLVRTMGYQMQPDPNRKDVNALTLAASGFVPRGDIVIDYRATDGDAELRAWAFTGGAAVPPDEKVSAKKNVGIDPKVVEAQRAVAADVRPTAVLALRPNLPRSRETKARDYMIVIDSSQSMVGERYTRATDLAVHMIEQMDRRDRFSVSACDSECRVLGDMRAPTGMATKDVKAFLAEQSPAGASDLVGSIRKASDFASDPGRQKWVLYVGDGFATTGFRRVGDVEAALAGVAQNGVQVTTVGIGGDADMALLAAAARGGGGSYLAWTPGQTAQIAALSAIESTNGAQLRNATVELPAGLADVAPTVIPTIRSGEEMLIAARINGDIDGKVIVNGFVGNEPFTQEYPLKLAVSASAGNGFVPRLWASLAIQQMERNNEDRIKTIALSQGYGVMSKETSLLVLESAAMFEAFGVDRSQPTAKWSGEDSIDEVVTGGLLPVTAQATGTATATGATGFGPSADADDMTMDLGAVANKGKMANERANDLAKKQDAPADKPRKAAKPKTTSRPAPVAPSARMDGLKDSMFDGGGGVGWGGGRGGMIAMRRTWVRVPSVTPYDGVNDRIKTAVANAEDALVKNPDSREKHRALVQALSFAGELDRAKEIAAKWLERDKLDPQALAYTADILGRDGQRELALRTLAGIVDLDADRVVTHERMVKAYEMSGRLSQACSHRIALASISPKDTSVAGATIRCLRSVGRQKDADIITKALPDDSARANAEKAATVSAVERKVGGDLVVKASWTGNADLDISLVTPAGERVSWMGGRNDVVVGDASSNEKEALSLKSIKRGNYLIEITRGAFSTGPMRGTVEINVLGSKRSMPFELLGSRAVVSRLGITLEERLEQVTNFEMTPQPRPVPLQARVAISNTDNDSVNRVVRARMGVFRACYQRELDRDPTIAGRLDVSFTVEADGSASGVMAGGAMNAPVTACVRANMQRLKYPTDAAGRYTLSLTFARQ